MKNKLLLYLIGFLIILFLLLIFGYFLYSERITNKVLTHLKENFEYCQVLKKKISFRGESKFWLYCNNRPFYATYFAGKINFKLNGWEFLKDDPKIWEDLENCDYYDTKDTKIIFYCPKDLSAEKIVAKIYSFSKKSFKLTKIEEKDLREIFYSDVLKIYPFLSTCEVKNFESIKWENIKSILWIIFKCEDGEYLLGSDLRSFPLQPPILLTGSNIEEIGRISFEKSFNLPVDGVEKFGEKVVKIISGNFEVIYNFSFGKPIITYYSVSGIKNEKEIEEIIKKFSRYFIFPPIQKIEKIEPIGKIEEETRVLNSLLYKVDGAIIDLEVSKKMDGILLFYRRTEKIYEEK
jgi:hypothetical protein